METLRHISLVFGTRPEIIKLSPVFAALDAEPTVKLTCTFTGQQANLAPEFLQEFGIPITDSLETMVPGQSVAQLTAKLMTQIDQVMHHDKPDVVIVQGDTSSALAAAMVAGLKKIPVMHVEAGLRTFNSRSPYPEETNRVLIAQLASHHFAATDGNRANLMQEGISSRNITVTGNPVIDVVNKTLEREEISSICTRLLNRIETPKFVVLTAHRRENFDSLIDAYFQVIVNFIEANPDFTLLALNHPNPTAIAKLAQYFSEHRRTLIVEPLCYRDFLTLVSKANLVTSDSGGIQEEVATLGTPLFILRELTERPEALDCGIAKLAPDATTLQELLRSFSTEQSNQGTRSIQPNPFGDGQSGTRIAKRILDILEQTHGG